VSDRGHDTLTYPPASRAVIGAGETIYRIKSSVLRAKGEKIEGLDPKRMERRLREVRRTQDPTATLLSIPRAR
jgi:hypothetical protein